MYTIITMHMVSAQQTNLCLKTLPKTTAFLPGPYIFFRLYYSIPARLNYFLVCPRCALRGTRWHGIYITTVDVCST